MLALWRWGRLRVTAILPTLPSKQKKYFGVILNYSYSYLLAYYWLPMNVVLYRQVSISVGRSITCDITITYVTKIQKRHIFVSWYTVLVDYDQSVTRNLI